MAGSVLATLYLNPAGPAQVTTVSTLTRTKTIASTASANTNVITTLTSTTTLTQTTTVPMNRNETLQFVGATVKDLGNSSVAINATFSNLLSSPQSVLLSGIAYPARGIYEPFSGGKPFGPICCPIVRSYSTNGSVSASAKVD